jgi:hypothetical protein
MSGGAIISVATHFVLKRSTILMSWKFGVAHSTCMTATTMGPAVNRGIACTGRSKTSASTSSTATALITALIAVRIATGSGWKLIIMLTGRIVQLIWWVLLVMVLALLKLSGRVRLILLWGWLLVGELRL